MNKIFYDINESNIFIDLYDFQFYFSSESLKNKFIREYEDYIEKEKIKLDTRYKMNIDRNFFLISLYKQIECRGYRIYFKKKKIKEEWVSIDYIIIEE